MFLCSREPQNNELSSKYCGQIVMTPLAPEFSVILLTTELVNTFLLQEKHLTMAFLLINKLY